MRMLFVCNMAMCRSPTGARVFSESHETDYAGIYSPMRPLTREMVEWAEIIYVMEQRHRREIGEWFPDLYLKKRIVSLDIPDIYMRDDPELVRLLQEKVQEAG